MLKFPLPDGFFPQISLNEREIGTYKRATREKLAALLALVEEGDKLYEWNNVPTSKGVVVQQAEGSGIRMSDKTEYHFSLLRSTIEMRGVTADSILAAISKTRTKEYRNMMYYLHDTSALVDARTLFKFPQGKQDKDTSTRAIKWFAWRPRAHTEGEDEEIIDFSVLEYAGKMADPSRAANVVAFCIQDSVIRSRDVPPLTAFGIQRGLLAKCGVFITQTEEEGVLRVTSFAHIDGDMPPQMHEVMEEMLRDYVAAVQRLHGLVGSFHVDGLAILDKSRWVSKRERKACAVCGSGFMLRRKHNCRACGEIVCSTCAPVHEVDAQVNGNTAEFRVCVRCVEKTATTTMQPRLRRKQSVTFVDKMPFRQKSQRVRSRSERNSGRDSDSWSQVDGVETINGSDLGSSRISSNHPASGNANLGESFLDIQYQQEIANLKAADAAREAALVSLQQERDMMSSRVLELEAQRTPGNDDCEGSPKLCMEDLEGGHTSEIQDAPTRFRSSLESISTTIAELRRENDSLSAHLNNSRGRNDVLDTRIMVLEEALASGRGGDTQTLQEELRQAQLQLQALAMDSSRRLSSSQSEVESLEFTIEIQNRTIAALEEEKDVLSGQLEELSSSQENERTLQSTIAAQSRAIASLEEEKALLSSRLATIEESGDEAKFEEMQLMKTTIETQNQAIVALEQEKVDLSSKLASTEMALQEAQRDASDLEEQLTNLRAAGRQRNEIVGSLQQENAALLFLMNKMEKRLVEAFRWKRGSRSGRRKNRDMTIMPQANATEATDVIMHSPINSYQQRPICPVMPGSKYAQYLAMQQLYQDDLATKRLSPWQEEESIRARSASAPVITDIPLSTLVAKVQEQRDAKLAAEEAGKSRLSFWSRSKPKPKEKAPEVTQPEEESARAASTLALGSTLRLQRQQLVHFCAFAPAQIDNPKGTFFYSVWAFSANNRKDMLKQAHAADKTCSCLSISDTALLIPMDACVSITLAAPRGYRVKNGCCQSLIWRGEVVSAVFEIRCSKKAADGNAAFNTRIAIVGADEALSS